MQNVMAAKPAKQEGPNSMKMQARKLNGLGQGNWNNGDAGGKGGIGTREEKMEQW
jgi:hypothetical protein